MRFNPTLCEIIDNAKAKYGNDLQTAAGALDDSEVIAALRLTVTEHLTVLGLRKASKSELCRIVLDALATEAAD
ncbi:hypothetical protein SAMN05216358_2730 [Rhizobium sp. AN5]|uniref:hypothetical protein n=1 Tax=Rhizobium sp. AN5 TaxID=1855304 RepID=UPI000BDD61B1|nr:hypothetical protein [Rhizobium sp. AN5]SOC92574.1 hypothetical protein SAMN05216358_2730 [Rhizobium sp. AN5]